MMKIREAALSSKDARHDAEPRATADDMDEPQDSRSSERAPDDTLQKDLDEQEKRKHEATENDLPSSQEKNPVSPEATRESDAP
ncbi:hypothetical protein B0G84_7940 [Paraburkholderia sp. BL8N3]|nr:hypothetical protein [Paraburkholderia sp. BL8N3]TCK33652.1 hypothetical protein B0G84_7940 [Paraburkholderia sp. BL8N3]